MCVCVCVCVFVVCTTATTFTDAISLHAFSEVFLAGDIAGCHFHPKEACFPRVKEGSPRGDCCAVGARARSAEGYYPCCRKPAYRYRATVLELTYIIVQVESSDTSPSKGTPSLHFLVGCCCCFLVLLTDRQLQIKCPDQRRLDQLGVVSFPRIILPCLLLVTKQHPTDDSLATALPAALDSSF